MKCDRISIIESKYEVDGGDVAAVTDRDGEGIAKEDEDAPSPSRSKASDEEGGMPWALPAAVL